MIAFRDMVHYKCFIIIIITIMLANMLKLNYAETEFFIHDSRHLQDSVHS